MAISGISGGTYSQQSAAVQSSQPRQTKTSDGDGDKDGNAQATASADTDGDSRRLLNIKA